MLSKVRTYFPNSPQTMCNTSADIWEIYRCLADDAVATRATLDWTFECRRHPARQIDVWMRAMDLEYVSTLGVAY